MVDAVILSIGERITASPDSYEYPFRVYCGDGTILTDANAYIKINKSLFENIEISYKSLIEIKLDKDNIGKYNADKDIIYEISDNLYKMWIEQHKNIFNLATNRYKNSPQCLFVIASDEADILNLPWELLPYRLNPNIHKKRKFLGTDDHFVIRRRPYSTGAIKKYQGSLSPLPLKILFMASSPVDLPSLDLEREEQLILKEIRRRLEKERVDIYPCLSGKMEELKAEVAKFNPHIIHLSGHVFLKKVCVECEEFYEQDQAICKRCNKGLSLRPCFAFEDECGRARFCDVDDVREQLNGWCVGQDGRRMARIIFFNACHTADAKTMVTFDHLCRGIVSNINIDDEGYSPLALGWKAPVKDYLACQFSKSFYLQLMLNPSIDQAVIQARMDIINEHSKDKDYSWILPVIYSTTDRWQVYDSDPNARRRLPRPSGWYNLSKELTDYIEYPDSFVGRRLEKADLKAREENIIVITGMGGVGKSSLATELTRRLEYDRYEAIWISCEGKDETEADKIVEKIAEKLRIHGKITRSTLDRIVKKLNEKKVVLLLDGLSRFLDKDRNIVGIPHLENFLEQVISEMKGNSKVIITTSYLPRIMDKLHTDKPHHSLYIKHLSEFPEYDSIKFLMRNEHIETQIDEGGIFLKDLSKLHNCLGGNPHLLSLVSNSLKKTETKSKELRSQISAMMPGEGMQDGTKVKNELQELRDEYIIETKLDKICNIWMANKLEMLLKAAVFTTPFTIPMLEKVTGLSCDDALKMVEEWERYSLVEDKCINMELWYVPSSYRERFQELNSSSEPSISSLREKIEKFGKLIVPEEVRKYCIPDLGRSKDTKARYTEPNELNELDEISKRALRELSCLNTPVTGTMLEDFAGQFTDNAQTAVEKWKELGYIKHCPDEVSTLRIWRIPAVLRSWLLDHEGRKDIEDSHAKARECLESLTSESAREVLGISSKDYFFDLSIHWKASRDECSVEYNKKYISELDKIYPPLGKIYPQFKAIQDIPGIDDTLVRR